MTRYEAGSTVLEALHGAPAPVTSSALGPVGNAAVALGLFAVMLAIIAAWRARQGRAGGTERPPAEVDAPTDHTRTPG